MDKGDIVREIDVPNGKIYILASGQIISKNAKLCEHCQLRGINTCPIEFNGAAYDENAEFETNYQDSRHIYQTCNRAQLTA